MNDPGQKPIFFDETNRRWGLVSYFFMAAGLIGLMASLVFAVSIVFSPKLPSISLTAARLGLAPALPEATGEIEKLIEDESPAAPPKTCHSAPAFAVQPPRSR